MFRPTMRCKDGAIGGGGRTVWAHGFICPTPVPRMTTAAPPAPAASGPPDVPSIPAHALGYRALKLWQRALDLATDAHRLARAFPDDAQLTLAADLRRSAAAVPAGIAASALALDRGDQHRAIQTTAVALARTETVVALAERVGLLAPADATTLLFTAGDVNRLLRGYHRAVTARTARVPELHAPPALAIAERPAETPAAAPAAAALAAPAAPTALATEPPGATPPSMRATRRRAPASPPAG